MKKILDFISIVARWVWTGIIPGVLVIVYKIEKDRVYYLLLRSKDYSTWHFVSGSRGWGESLKQTAEKEIDEEIGGKTFNLQETPIIHNFRYRNLPFMPSSRQTVYIVPLTIKEASDLHPQNEIVELKWVEKSKVTSYLTFPELQDTFLKTDAFIEQEVLN